MTGVITLPEGTEMCMPGDNVDMKVELITPIAIEKVVLRGVACGGCVLFTGGIVSKHKRREGIQKNIQFFW